MVKPLDVYLGQELSPARQAAIDAVREFYKDDERAEFWDRVSRVEAACAEFKVEPRAAAKALDLIDPYMQPDGERGHMAIFDHQINGLIAAIGRSI